MRILNIDTTPLSYYPCKSVRQIYNIPIYQGWLSGLSNNLDALIVASDLQCYSNNKTVLVGEVLPEFLSLLIETDLKNIQLKRTGVILCGDFFAKLEKLGGLGDVKNVWKNFANVFKWVVGIAGNHDDFGTKIERNQFKKILNIHLLEKEMINLDQLKIAGLHGIIGTETKPNRISEQTYLETLATLARKKADFILLHESPDHPKTHSRGNPIIRQLLARVPKNLIFCGHCFWENSFQILENGTQLLNSNSKIFILQKEKIIGGDDKIHY